MTYPAIGNSYRQVHIRKMAVRYLDIMSGHAATAIMQEGACLLTLARVLKERWGGGGEGGRGGGRGGGR